MRRISISIVAMFIALAASGEAGRAIAAQPATVLTDIHDASHNAITGADVQDGAVLHVSATVNGAGATPTGIVRFRTYDGAGCVGAASAEQSAPLTTGTEPVSHSIEISNAAGDDSATIWSSQAGSEFATDWFGSVFMGTDPPFFSHSGAGWRFTDVPISASDTIDSAYLRLRIAKSRPNLASETFGTWQTAIRVDASSGADFAGLDNGTFVGRFGSGGVSWQIPFSLAQPDPFGTQQGETYAQTPDIAALVASRISGASWSNGSAIVVGVLDNASPPTAEAQVIDAADNVRLHIAWTSHEPVGRAESIAFTATAAARSYRVHYDVDAAYGPGDGPCVAVNVTPPDADGDGYSDAAEVALGKDPNAYCDVMRADVDADATVSILDLSRVAQWFGQSAPPAPGRYLQDGDSAISILDLAQMARYFLESVSICP